MAWANDKLRYRILARWLCLLALRKYVRLRAVALH